MHQEKYNLTWQTYSDHLKSMMRELMTNEEYSDVTLVTEDKQQINANIHILSACSPVFKDILKKEKNYRTIMYLKGIQYSEMESIMQFIYLGEATFHEEKMDKLLAVAKSLEITELCNAVSETKNEPEEEQSTTNQGTINEKLKEQTIESVPFSEREIVNVNSNYECEPCQKIFTRKDVLTRHIQSKHDGIKYACDQCEYQTTQQGHLDRHIQSKHEGVRYACDQCDNHFTRQESLTEHIQSKHEGTKYACDQCDHQFTLQNGLKQHKKSIHQGLKYACDQCDYQATQLSNLRRHMKKYHLVVE